MADYPLWQQVASQLPASLPDETYDSLRDSFFHDQLWPRMVAAGTPPMQRNIALNQFLSETERKGKSSTPQLDVFAASAAAGLLKPIASIGAQLTRGPQASQRVVREIDAAREATVQEAERQGQGSGVAEFAGSVVGSLPYFIPAARVARGAAALAGAGELAATAIEGAGAVGAYDAAAAPAGGRLEAGAKGAAMGAAGNAAIHGVGAAFRKIFPKAAAEAETAAAPPTASADAGALVRQEPGADWQYGYRDPVNTWRQRQLGEMPTRQGDQVVGHEFVEPTAPRPSYPEPPPDQPWYQGPAGMSQNPEAAGRAGLLPRATEAQPVERQLPSVGQTELRSEGRPVLQMPENPQFLQRVEMDMPKSPSIRERIAAAMPPAEPMAPPKWPETPWEPPNRLLGPGPAKLSAELETIPETPQTLGAQLEQLKKGERRVVMFPEGSQMPDRAPAGLKSAYSAGVGRFYFDPKAITPKQISKAIETNTLPDILGARFGGMGAPDKSRLQGNVFSVIARNDLGIITQETVTDQANLQRTIAQTQKLGTVSVETAEETIARRLAAGSRPAEGQNGAAIQRRKDIRTGAGAEEDFGILASREPKTPFVVGHEGEIHHPGSSEAPHRFRYVFGELEDAHASHSGQTFQPNPNFWFSNQRDYMDPTNQLKVITNASNWNSKLVLAHSPTITNGAPVLDRAGNVLGGNGRFMSLERVYGGAGAAQMRKDVIDAARSFGADPEAVARMRRPMLFRQLVDESLANTRAGGEKVIDIYNPRETAALTSREQALSDARNLTPRAMEIIDGAIANAGEGASFADTLRGKGGKEILQSLADEGVIHPGDIPGMQEPNGEPTEIAKVRMQKMILGSLIGDRFDITPPSMRLKLERAAAPSMQLLQRPEWDLGPTVRRAIDLIEQTRVGANEGKVTPQAIDAFIAGDQQTLTSAMDYAPHDVTMAKVLLTEKPVALGRTFREYSQLERLSRPGEASMGLFGEPPTQQQAWEMLFEGKPGTVPGAPGEAAGGRPIASTGEYFGTADDAEIPMRERPSGRSAYTGGRQIPGMPEDVLGVTGGEGEGAWSTLRSKDRGTVFHETMHRWIKSFAIDDAEGLFRSVDPSMADALSNALPTLTGGKAGRYAGNAAEETVVMLHTAVRTGDEATIDTFVKHDGSREEVLDFSRKTAQAMQREISIRPDSPQKAIAERKLADLVRRSRATIQDLREDVMVRGGKLKVEGSDFYVQEKGSNGWKLFDDRDSLIDYLERTEWPAAKELLPEAQPLPGTPGMPPTGGAGLRYSTGTSTEPPPPDPKKVRLGTSAISGLFRPFLPWLADVAKLTGNEQLYRVRLAIDNGLKMQDRAVHEIDQQIHQLVTKFKISAERRHELGLYQIAQRLQSNDMMDTATGAKLRKVAANMQISEKEKQFLDAMGGITDKLFDDFGININMYSKEYISIMSKRVKDPELKIETYGPSKDFKFFAEEIFAGKTENFETDYFAILRKYVRSGYFKKFVAEHYDAYVSEISQTETLMREFGSDQVAKYGLVKDTLMRDAKFVRGVPDDSQKVIESAIGSAIDGLNSVLAGARAKAPAWAKKMLGPIEMMPDEALRKFITVQYAGSMGLRLGLVARNMTQVFLAFPMMDAEHFAYGLARGITKEAVDLAEKYNVRAFEGQMSQFLSESEANTASGRITKLAQKTLEPQRISDNATRTMVFTGFYRQVSTAARAFKKISQPTPRELNEFMKQSGMGFLDEPMAKMFGDRIVGARTDAELADVVGEAAARLTETSQWSFTRGAQAGAYKYGAGRLLGQFGTWPSNFVEYLRRLGRNPYHDNWEKGRTATKMAAMQLALFKAGEALGVDMAGEVFLAPGGFSGGPMLQSALNLPSAVMRWDERGDDPRKKAFRPLTTTSVPGGMAIRDALRAIASDDPNTYRKILQAQGVPMMPDKNQTRLHRVLDFEGEK